MYNFTTVVALVSVLCIPSQSFLCIRFQIVKMQPFKSIAGISPHFFKFVYSLLTNFNIVNSCFRSMFYKVTGNIEAANPESLLQVRNRVRFLGASGHNIFTNSSIHNLAFCVFLLKDTVFNIVCQFINIELPASCPVTHA